MKLKKILAGAAVAVTAVACLSVSAFAEDRDPRGEQYGNFWYKVLGDGTVKITAYSGDDDNVKIPDTIDGMTVTVIDEGAFSQNTNIVTVEIPDHVITIGDNAFYYCISLNEIVIPDSVTTIGEDAFLQCNSLTEIDISDNVTEIGHGAFSWCTSLTSIAVKQNNPNYASVDGVLFDKKITTLIQYPTGKQNTKYSIPNEVTTIGKQAFGFSSLSEIVIPDSVTEIGDMAFWCCTSLTDIVIPNSVAEIGYDAFYNCNTLTEIVIPDSVTAILPGTFRSCNSLESLTIPASVTDLDINMFLYEVHFDVPWEDYIPENLTIYGYAGSAAEALAKEYEINFVVLKEEPSKEPTTIEDKETGIEISAADGVLPEGAVLTVKADEENSSDTAVAFDITVTVDGKPADINGTVTVTIPVPEELKGKDKYYVYYKAEDGTLTDMKATCKDGVITFTTTHFSTYIVSAVDLLADNGSGDGNPDTGVTLLLIPAIAAAAAVVISKKRK